MGRGVEEDHRRGRWKGQVGSLFVVPFSLTGPSSRFAHAFMFDTGSATGEILGHSKIINAVSIRAQRPFKAVTAGDDTNIVFHSGVPFKHEKVRHL